MTDNENLVKLIQIGYNRDDNLLQLWDQNKPLLLKMVRQYKTPATTTEDLMQEAFIGFMRAIEDYDETRGVKFMSYAQWHIESQLGRSMSKQEAVRVPEHARELYLKYKRFLTDWEQSTGEAPSKKEVIQLMDLSGGQYDTLQRLNILLNQASLDTPVGAEEGEVTLVEFVPDGIDIESLICERLFDDYVKVTLWAEVDKLDGLKPKILRRYYQDDLSLEELAVILDITPERVRQIRYGAEQELRTKGVLARLFALNEFEQGLSTFNTRYNRPEDWLGHDEYMKQLEQDLIRFNLGK